MGGRATLLFSTQSTCKWITRSKSVNIYINTRHWLRPKTGKLSLSWCEGHSLGDWDILAILQWRHNERDGVSYHRRLHCLFNCWFRRRSKKTSKVCVTGFCEGNSPVTGEFPAQKASNAENVSIWWRHHENHGFWGFFHHQSIWNACNDHVW